MHGQFCFSPLQSAPCLVVARALCSTQHQGKNSTSRPPVHSTSRKRHHFTVNDDEFCRTLHSNFIFNFFPCSMERILPIFSDGSFVASSEVNMANLDNKRDIWNSNTWAHCTSFQSSTSPGQSSARQANPGWYPHVHFNCAHAQFTSLRRQPTSLVFVAVSARRRALSALTQQT